ncbi:unnamed protein product [Periconia digitata]|uniref:AB hydrolase-1 domain-containing protein n=1 Tax=Periconia digitata TaxID=1303443 RepID=A0A9W4U7R8_9PLEO|nr:unnamed protein product [Periconia digitata]
MSVSDVPLLPSSSPHLSYALPTMKSHSSTLIAALALCHQSLSSPTYQTAPDHPSNGICTDYKIEKTIDFAELQWTDPPFKTSFDVVDLYARMASKDPAVFRPFAETPRNVSKTYEISATFCRPKNGTDAGEKTVLVATHGAGFDRRYWASSYLPEKYSFVYHSLEAGYPVFYYDRAGVGASSRTLNYTAQPEPQIQLLASMVRDIRGGQYTDSIKASKIVLVGHSFGSFVSTGLLNKFPDLADAAVLTGIAFPNPSDIVNILGKYALTVFGGRLISDVPSSSLPANADSFDDSHVAFGDIYSYAQAFLHHPQTAPDVAVANYTFSITQPLPVSEFASLGNIDLRAPDFAGKVLITAGQYDVLCGGDCYATFDAGVQNTTIFSNEGAVVETFVQPGAGHGAVFQEDNGARERIFGFLGSV